MVTSILHEHTLSTRERYRKSHVLQRCSSKWCTKASRHCVECKICPDYVWKASRYIPLFSDSLCRYMHNADVIIPLFSPAYFRRKAQAHSVWLSVLLYVLLSVLTSFFPSVFHMKVQNSYSYISILLKLYRCLNHALNCACGLDIIIRLTFDIFSQFELSNLLGV